MMEVPCELEKVMIKETTEIIRNHYDNREGVKALFVLLNTSQGKSGQ